MSLAKLLTVIILAVTPIVTAAQLTVARALRSAPFELLAPLPMSTLSSMLDIAESGVDSHVDQNLMLGECKIEHFDSLGISLTTGNSRRLDVYLLPAGHDTVIAVIETLHTSAGPDAHMTLWDRNWHPALKFWKEPKTSGWLSDAGKKNRAVFERNVDFILADYSFNPDSGVLTLTNRTAAVQSSEQQSATQDLMLPMLRYVWTSKGFKPAK